MLRGTCLAGDGEGVEEDGGGEEEQLQGHLFLKKLGEGRGAFMCKAHI